MGFPIRETFFLCIFAVIMKHILPLSLATLAAVTSCRDNRPNIVIFFADDIGTDCFGCYTGAEYATPCVDSLSRHGILYENMNAQPLSTPSRVQLMTGMYNDRNYVNFGYINDDENTIGHLAQRAGYSTAMVGKWQLGTDRNIAHRLGFDETFLGQVEFHGVKDKEHHTDRYAASIYDNNGREYVECEYGPDEVQKYAFDYIDRQVRARKPFMLYYSATLVHTPHVSTPDSDVWYSHPETRYVAGKDTSNFKYMVSYLDKAVGQMAQHLKDQGIWDNTIFIFTADNGTTHIIQSRQQDGTTVWGGKGTPTYRGTHVPMIITWGERLAGRRSSHLADLTDIMPTIADAMKVKVPSSWEQDGVSLYPELRGKAPNPKPLVLIHFNPLWPQTTTANASRYAMGERYAYFWDGRIYDYRTDPTFQHPLMYNDAPQEVRAEVAPLKARVDEIAFTPDMPGAPRHGDYKSFYDADYVNTSER